MFTYYEFVQVLYMDHVDEDGEERELMMNIASGDGNLC